MAVTCRIYLEALHLYNLFNVYVKYNVKNNILLSATVYKAQFTTLLLHCTELNILLSVVVY